MRMHRGSSKDAAGRPPATESLPLSASAPELGVVLAMTRAGSVELRSLTVRSGTTVRSVLRRIGAAPEGCAVLDGETPVPLDTPVDRTMRLTVVSTFSGG